MYGAVILLTLVLALSFLGSPPPGHVDEEGTVARALQEPGEPVAVISPLPEKVSNGTDKILSASLSYDSDGKTLNETLNYTWEIEVNGTVEHIYGMSKWYRFEVPGLYMIKLTVTDEDNQTAVDFTATLSMVDSDEDGLLDWWEEYYLFNLNYGAVDDPDGDGYRNIDEYYSGTDPRVYDDHPPGVVEQYGYYMLGASVAAAVAAALLYRRQRRRRKEESVRKMDYAVEIEKALEVED
jgi:hypothetical protein